MRVPEYSKNMFDKKDLISRRNFLQKSLIGVGGLILLPKLDLKYLGLDQWPQGELLGRNTVYQPSALPIRTKPAVESTIVRHLQEDEVVVWLREVLGKSPVGRPNKAWVETPEGYIYAPSLQKVKNIPNTPVNSLPTANGETGMWVEVTVPYVNMEIANPPTRAPWLNEVHPSRWRLYYSQVIWVDEIKTEVDGRVLYRLNERYGSYGDIFWADAAAFRIITPEEIAPINPEAADKNVLVNINQQSLTCFEGNNEVYYCRVATGRKLDEYGTPVDTWATPVGEHWIWRKLMSLHMSGGGTGAGWDTMSVPWTSLFVGEGVAIHSTFWHNDFGTPKSHGCVNALPEDSKWIFRWSTPQVFYNPGDITSTTYEGTKIKVTEPLY
jgi:lipoprotein-anchoring transpeptidase ErfK/SrfK